jgi:hypothetical protein
MASIGKRLWPPARIFASGPYLAISCTASSSEPVSSLVES